MLLRPELHMGCLLLIGAIWFGGTEACAREPSVQAEDPAKRIRAAIHAAWKHGAKRVEAEARLTAESYAAKVETRAGPPFLEYQREGIGSSFGNALNSTNYLRLGKPFNVPWQWQAGRALVTATETYVSSARLTTFLNIALQVGLAWIELAAAEVRISVRERQLDRSRQALRLHRKRLEMGEVSGSEVTQVELECARQFSDLASLRSRAEEALMELERLTGQGTFEPMPGDLARLAAQFETLPADQAWYSERVDQSPFIQAAQHKALQERRSADLAQTQAWGRPEVEVEWEHVPSLEGQEAFDALGWRILVPLPVDRSGWERRKESRANLAAVDARERIAKREVTAQVRIAAVSARAAEEALREMEALIAGIPDTERSLAEQFRLGTISYLVYFDSLSRLDDVVLQYEDAMLALLKARLELAVVLHDPSIFPLPEPSPEDVQ